MTDKTYNGWTNWDTWNAHLWISSTEWAYFGALATRDPDALRRFIKSASGILSTGDHEFGDGFDPDDVNWDEVWEAINEE